MLTSVERAKEPMIKIGGENAMVGFIAHVHSTCNGIIQTSYGKLKRLFNIVTWLWARTYDSNKYARYG